jgi:hypothetical protein
MRRLLLAAMPLLLGCVQSVNPLHTAETTVLDSALLGTWRFEGGDLLVVTQRDSTSYRFVSVAPAGEVGTWVGWLTALGERRWIDARPEDLPDTWSEEYREGFLPLYHFWVVLEAGERLRVASLRYDSLRAALARDPAALAHAHGVDNRILLTASTGELRRFLQAFAEQPGVLEESDEPARRVARAP